MGILKYSNGWGHLLMSIASLGVGVYLIIMGYGTIGTSLIATVTAAWFIPGAAKQVAYQVENVTAALPAKTEPAKAATPPVPSNTTKAAG